MPINSQQSEKDPDHATAPRDPFVDSIQSVSRQNSLPFWLDRSWIPAESEYPTDDEDRRGLFGIKNSTPQVLVYDWAHKALNIKPLDIYKYPNSSDGMYQLLHIFDPGLMEEGSHQFFKGPGHLQSFFYSY